MLDRIEIRNFKAIQNEPLELKGLTNVNYLVGKNGSGKSSVLEGFRICITTHTPTSEIFTSLGDFRSIFRSNTKFIFDLEYSRNNILEKKKFETSFVKDATSANGFTIKPTDHDISTEPYHLLLLYYHVYTLSNQQHLTQTLSLDFDSIEEDIKDDLIDFLNEYEPIFKTDKVVDVYKSLGRASVIQLRTNTQVINLKSLANGVKILVSIYLTLLYPPLQSQKTERIILIEEPETGLHPEYQKLIPEMIKRIAIEYNKKGIKTQFFISTHSPFIISAAAKLVEDDYDDFKNLEENKGLSAKEIKNKFKPSQKVYQIEDGQCNIEEGVWGAKSISTSAKMLGAGFSDLFNFQEPRLVSSPTVILCEGKTDRDSQEDAIFYNEVFRLETPSCLFISCQGHTQITPNFLNFYNLKQNTSGNFNTFSLKDRDAEFSTIDELNNKVSINPTLKYLYRRCLECYIYSIETLLLYSSMHNVQINNVFKSELEGVLLKIQESAEKQQSSVAKDIDPHTKPRELWLKSLSLEKISICDIGKLISANPESTIFKELHTSIFGEK